MDSVHAQAAGKNAGRPDNLRLAAALDYAGRRWPVFPLHEITPDGSCSCSRTEKCTPGKHPRTARGFKEATTDEKQIRDWWATFPNANVGVVTGTASGLLMIGPDGAQGIADLDALAAANGGLPETAVTKSGSGGRHYLFRWPAGVPAVRNKQNHRGSRIDVRGAGGYFVAPPSANAVGGYEWVDDRVPAEAPPWLLEWACDEPKSTRTTDEPNFKGEDRSEAYRRASRYVAKMPAAVSGQGGHPATMAAARAAVHGFDLGAELGFQLLVSEFNPRCVPEWTERELRHKCADADKGDYDKPRGSLLRNGRQSSRQDAPEPPGGRNAPPPPAPPRPNAPAYVPFPLETLAPVLRDYVTEVAASIPADPAFAALPALTIAGAAAGAAIAISPKAMYQEVPALWSCVVGDSGTGKSPAARPTERLAFSIDTRMKLRYEAEVANYVRELDAWKNCDDPPGPDPATRPAKPVREHFVVVDCTIERLAEVLAHSTRGVVMNRDELAGWFGGFTRYKGKAGGTDVPNWLSLFEAGPLRVHRRTGEPRDIEVDRSFVAVTGGIQPGILRDVLGNPDYVASGLAARIVFAYPPKEVPRWSEAEVSQAVVDRFAAALDFLRDIPFDPRCGPRVVKLSPDAKRRFVAMSNEFAAAAEGEDGGPMAAAFPKATRIALRLALIDHCLRHADTGSDPTTTTVSDVSMEAGEIQARWFAREAARVYAMCTEDATERDERTLLDWVRRKHPGGVTARDVQRSLSRFKASGLAEAALADLVKAGRGSWHDRPAGPKGGAPTRVFVPNPADATDGGRGDSADSCEEDGDASVPSASAGGDDRDAGKRRYQADDRPHEARDRPAGGTT